MNKQNNMVNEFIGKNANLNDDYFYHVSLLLAWEYNNLKKRSTDVSA